MLTIAPSITALSIGIPLIIFLKQKQKQKEDPGNLEETVGYQPTKEHLGLRMKRVLGGVGITTVALLIIGAAVDCCTVPVLKNIIHHSMSVATHPLIMGVLSLYFKCHEDKGSQLIEKLYAQSAEGEKSNSRSDI